MTEDTASKTKGLLWLVTAGLLGALFAFGLSPLAHIVPWPWEKKLSRTLDFGSSSPECLSDAGSRALLQRFVARLYPIYPADHAFSIDVRIVSDPVVNAEAMLGGRIFIHAGLLRQAESPEELAGVLAHEIEHVHHRHIMEGLLHHLFTVEGLRMIFGDGSAAADWTRYAMNMDFSRAQESQADEDGLRRLQAAHVDNHGFRQFFERMEKSDSALAFFSDHPSSHDRSERAAAFDNRETTAILTSGEWDALKAYCRKP